MNTKRLYLYQLICILLPPSKCHGLKSSLLRWCGAKVGNNVEIMSSAKILGNMDLEIGDNVFIGHDTLIVASAKVIIGAHVNIAPRVYIGTGTLELDTNGVSIAGRGAIISFHNWRRCMDLRQFDHYCRS